MANHVNRYQGMLIPVTTAVLLPNNAIAVGSFLATTAGTISLQKADGSYKIQGFPVAAGQVVTMNCLCDIGAIFTTAGGASGTLTYDS